MLSRLFVAVTLLVGCYRSHELRSEDGDAAVPASTPRAPWFGYAAATGSSPSAISVFVTRVGDEAGRVVSGAVWAEAEWSPTTRTLATAWIDGEHATHFEAFTYDDDGLTDRRVLWASPERFFMPVIAWAPTGAHVAAVVESADTRASRVLVFDTEGALVADWEGTSALWSPDGRSLASIRGSGPSTELLHVAIDGGAVRALTMPADLVEPDSPLWSPDSSRLVVQAERPAERGQQQLVVVERDSLTTRTLTPAAFFSVGHTRWSTDGSWLLFRGTSLTPTADARFYVQPVTGSSAAEPREVAALEDPGGSSVRTDADWTSTNRLLLVQSTGTETRSSYLTFRDHEVLVEDAFVLGSRCEVIRRPVLPVLMVLDCQGPTREHRLQLWHPLMEAPSPRLLGELAQTPYLDDVDSWKPGAPGLLFATREDTGWAIYEADAELGLVRRQTDAKRWTNVRPNSLRPWSTEASAYWFRRSNGEVVIEHLGAGLTWPVARPDDSTTIRVYGFAPE